MQIQIKAQNTQLTESAKVYVDEKIGRLSKFLSQSQDEAALADVHLLYKPSHTDDAQDECHVTISGLGRGLTFHVEEARPDMHVAIDAVSQRLEEQLRRLKEKTRDNIDHEKAAAKEIPAETFMETDPVDDDK